MSDETRPEPSAREERSETRPATERPHPAGAPERRPETAEGPPRERREPGPGGESGRGYQGSRDDGRSGPPRGRGGPGGPGGPGGRPRFRSFYRRKVCKFCVRKVGISFRDADALRRFITDRGKILPRRITGTCPKHQRALSKAIKQARVLALLPFVEK